MKFIFSGGFVFAFFLIQTTSTFAAPAIYQMAINKTTHECAGYWAGDEFVTYTLPAGWIAYPYEFEKDGIFVKTDVGICRAFKKREDCCRQIGYKFVSENIGKTQNISSLRQRNKMGFFSLIKTAVFFIFRILPCHFLR